VNEAKMNEDVVNVQDASIESDTAAGGGGIDARTRVLAVGAVLGLVFGIVAAQLYLNVTPVEMDQEGQEQIAIPSPGRMLKFGLGALTLLRQIVE
jgi:hypothetical protein